MRRNDLIVIEFSNPSGAELLLSPALLQQCADSLRGLFTSVAQSGPNDIEIFLADVERGSLRFGFLPKVAKSVKEVTDALQGIVALGGVIFTAGVYLGYFSPAGPASTSEVAIEHQINIEQICRPGGSVEIHLKNLVRHAVLSKAEQVSISFPTCPTALVVSEKSNDVSLIGSAAEQLDFGAAKFEGRVDQLQGPYAVEIGDPLDDQKFQTYVGRIMINGDEVKVLILWQPKRKISDLNQMPDAKVVGALHRLGDWPMRATAAINPDLRDVQALLVANGVMVIER